MATGLLASAAYAVAVAGTIGWTRRPEPRAWPRLLAASWPLGLSNLFTNALLRLDVLVMSLLLGMASVGFYGASLKLMEPMRVLPAAIVTTIFPLFSAQVGRAGGDERASYSHGLRWTAIVGLPLLVAVGALPVQAITLLAGERFTPAAAVLPWLAAAEFFILLFPLNYYLLVAQERRIVLFSISATAAVANITLDIALMPSLGLVGAGIASLIAYAVPYLMQFAIPSTRHLVVWLVAAVARPVTAAMAAWAVMAALADNPIAALLLGGLAYMGVLGVSGAITAEDHAVGRQVAAAARRRLSGRAAGA